MSPDSPVSTADPAPHRSVTPPSRPTGLPTRLPTGLPRARPHEHGLRAAAVEDFLDAVDRAADVELHSLMVLRHGQVLAEGWWAPYRPDDSVQLYSLSKSFTSAATGFAVAEGLLGLDEPAIEVFEEFADVITDERVRRLTVGECLRMATGHREDTLERAYTADSEEPLRGFFALPLDDEPGSIFCYNNTATYLVAAAVQRRAQTTLTEYLRPRLFEPLGINTPFWQAHPTGREIGFAGLHLPTEAIARFGQLCLDLGRWQGRSVLPGGWVEEATRRQTDNADQEENSDWQQGYGYQYWMSRHGYRGDGAFGQFCLILPERDAVIAITAQTEQMQKLLDLVWTLLLPGFTDSAQDQDHDQSEHDQSEHDQSEHDQHECEDRLVRRLRRLRLPTPSGGARPDGLEFPSEWSRPETGRAETDQPENGLSIRLVQLSLDPASNGATRGAADIPSNGSGAAGLLVLEHEHPYLPESPPIRYTFRFGRDWHRESIDLGERRLRYAAAGGWTHGAEPGDRPNLVVEIAFLNSPHRLRVDADVAAGTAEVDWVTAPLGAPVPIEVSVPNR